MYSSMVSVIWQNHIQTTTPIDNLRSLVSMVLFNANHLQFELYSSLIPQEVSNVVLVLLALILYGSTYKFSTKKSMMSRNLCILL